MNILILENEQIVALDIKLQLYELKYKNVFLSTSYEEAKEVMKKYEISFAILDIDLGTEKTGIDFADYLNYNFGIPFVYLSGNSKIHEIDSAILSKPNAYLSKPIQPMALYSTIQIAIGNYQERLLKLKSELQCIFIKENGRFFRINLTEIKYVNGRGNYVLIVTKNCKHTVRGTMKNFNRLLKGLPFLKVQKSFIVNLEFLKEMNNTSIFIDDVIIPITPESKKQILEIMTVF